LIFKLWQKRLYRPEAWKLMARDWIGERGPVLDNSFHLKEAADWILRAQAGTPDDGVCGGYSFEDGWIPSYPETTGYIIPTLIGYSKYSGNRLYLERSAAMSEWELSCQLECGAFPGHFVDRVNPPVVFNTGQIIFGLLAAYEEFKDERFLDSALRAGAWLASVQEPDGSFRRHEYHGVVHSYNTRVAWAMIELAKVSADDQLRRAAIRCIEWALGEQTENGWIRHASFIPYRDPFLHTIAYVAQGFLEAGCQLKCEKYVEAARRIGRALISKVNEKGFIAGVFDRHWQPRANYSCLTGNAQMAVLWLRLYQLHQDAIYLQTAQRALHFLKSLQNCETDNLCVRGAIKGSHPISGRYLFGTYPNWAPKFFMDALLLEETIRTGNGPWIRCW